MWGNLDDDNIVWGNLYDDNIVWGNNDDDNIVWGNSLLTSSSKGGQEIMATHLSEHSAAARPPEAMSTATGHWRTAPPVLHGDGVTLA